MTWINFYIDIIHVLFFMALASISQYNIVN